MYTFGGYSPACYWIIFVKPPLSLVALIILSLDKLFWPLLIPFFATIIRHSVSHVTHSTFKKFEPHKAIVLYLSISWYYSIKIIFYLSLLKMTLIIFVLISTFFYFGLQVNDSFFISSIHCHLMNVFSLRNLLGPLFLSCLPLFLIKYIYFLALYGPWYAFVYIYKHACYVKVMVSFLIAESYIRYLTKNVSRWMSPNICLLQNTSHFRYTKHNILHHWYNVGLYSVTYSIDRCKN